MTRGQWLFHFTAYYTSWVGCIYYAAQGQVWTGPFIAIGCLLAQIIWQNIWNKEWQAALFYASVLTLVAIIVDSILLQLHWITFKATPFANKLPPPWIIMMWLSFGFNLILLNRKWLTWYKLWAILILIGLPFAYHLGAIAGAATVTTPFFYMVLGGTWLVLLPLSLVIFNRFEASQS